MKNSLKAQAFSLMEISKGYGNATDVFLSHWPRECQPQPHCTVEDHGRQEAEATTDADSHSVTTNKSVTYIRKTKIDLCSVQSMYKLVVNVSHVDIKMPINIHFKFSAAIHIPFEVPFHFLRPSFIFNSINICSSQASFYVLETQQ